MNFYILSIFGVLAIFGATGTDAEDILPSCQGLIMRIAKKQIKSFGECSKEIRAVVKDDDEFSNKIQCVLKCVLSKAGILNEDKQVTKVTMQTFMDKHVPEVYHSVSHDLMEHCTDQFGPKMNDDDELCTVYGDYVKCLQEVVASVSGNVC